MKHSDILLILLHISVVGALLAQELYTKLILLAVSIFYLVSGIRFMRRGD